MAEQMYLIDPRHSGSREFAWTI